MRIITRHKTLAFIGCWLLGAAALLTSCNDDELSQTSVFHDSTDEPTAFDNWIFENYVMPYNIDFKYHLDDKETDFTYSLVPADRDNAVKMAHCILYCWLQAYDEVAGAAFTRKYVPKVIQLVGSAAHNRKGTVVMGTAEDGMKVTLYGINLFKQTKSYLNSSFQIMHHEFTHILTQHKEYDTEFQKISENDYITGEWETKYESEALQAGFIDAYAMSEYNEDFAETLSFYLTYTQAEWNSKMRMAGEQGAAIIAEKLAMIRSYLKTAWNIDIDQLRDVVQRRMDDIVAGKVDIETLNT